MKLYTTLTSPYGRMARIVILEKGLTDRVAIEVPQTRVPNSPYYRINPSGRVPFLQLEDGTGLEDSALICQVLDGLDGAPSFQPPAGQSGLEQRRLEAIARSMLDGISLWAREHLYRPPEIRSDVIMDHEAARAARLADVFEREVTGAVMSGRLNMAQITLASALHGRDGSPPGFHWRTGRPQLAAWVDRLGARASVASTVPERKGH